MSSIKTTEIEGDVAIGRNVTAGGNADINGNAVVHKNLKVEGWLDAKNIKGPNKGIFLNVTKLREAYPLPHDGWWALVGNTLPAPLYIADGGAWVATGETAGNPTIDSEQYNQAVAELDAQLKSVAADVATNKTSIEQIRTQINTIGSSVNTLTSDVSGLKTRMTTAESDITNLKNQKGKANGLAPLDETGKVPSSHLPGFVDDVKEFHGFVSGVSYSPSYSGSSTDEGSEIVFDTELNIFLLKRTESSTTGKPRDIYYISWADRYLFTPNQGTQNTPYKDKVYVDVRTNKTYRWSGSQMVVIGSDLALGHTAETAFPGDEGENLQTELGDVQNRLEEVEHQVSEIKMLPCDGQWDGKGTAPTTGVWLCPNGEESVYFRSFGGTDFYGYPEEQYNSDIYYNTGYIYRVGDNLYRIENDKLVKVGGGTSNYNVTVEQPLPNGEYYTDLQAETIVHNVLQTVLDAGKAQLGLTITFAIGPSSWKTYQYVGVNTTPTQFLNADNWVDLAGMTAGEEPFINVNELCGDDDYTLSTAVQTLIEKEKTSGIAYRKLGLVITYRRNADPAAWETKQYIGSNVLDMTPTNEGLWKDFGGGGSDVEATDDLEADSKKAITSGAVYNAFKEKPIVNFDEQSDAENYIFQGVNEKGEAVGDAIKFPKSNQSGQASGSTLNIYPETQAVWGAFGSRITLRAAIKSTSYDGDTEINGTIRTVSILDALTRIVLWTEAVNTASSTSASDYKFEFDFTDFITSASAKDFIIQATDADGNTKTKTITVTAVDVTCECIQTLNYSSSTALEEGGSVKSLPMYKFPNNVSTKSGILVKTEMYYNGEWKTLGTATVYDSYSHNISINPTNAFGGNERLSHGSYPIRIQGTDVASGVQGNTIYTAMMCIEQGNETPVVSLRYDDNNNGKVRLYDNLDLDVAAYTYGKTNTAVEVLIDGVVITTVNCPVGQSYRVSKQVQGYSSDGSKQIDIYAQSGSAKSVTITLTVEGSAIDASVKDGALFTFDFSTRSNNETDHTIAEGSYKMELEGCNYNSNGFVEVLGEQTLRIAENVKAEINYAPFSSGTLETAGMAVQMAFSTKSIKDPEAILCKCYDPASGAGFYIKGNEIVVTVLNGTPKKQTVRFKNNEKVTVAVVVEPGSKYVTYNSGSGAGTNYSFVKLYVNGEECAALGYQPGTSALRQGETIQFDSENGDFNLNYIMAYNSYMEWLQAFQNYLCRLSDVTAMIAEFDKENVLDTTGKPSMTLLAAKGIPYYVIVAEQSTFDNFDYAQNGGTNTSDQFACTLYYYNPQHPEVNFKATNVLWRRQGTTSAQRPIKNDRFNFNKKNKSTGLKATVTLLNPDESTELGRKAIKAAKYNKVFVSETGFFVDTITVKVDYSDSSNANDCGVCDMMNATFRALGSNYMTPAQRAFTGEQILGEDDKLTDIQMDHSTKNHPVAALRATQDTLQDAYFHAKGNWKEDKGEQIALGFQDTPGYNLGCLNYGDFVEYFGNKGESLSALETRFKQDGTTDTSKIYLLSQYCGRDYAIYRYVSGSWTKSKGSMKQVGGKWQVTGDVLNPVSGYELLQYAGMDWWQGVSSVEDMMAPTTQKSSWVTKLELSNETYPAWTFYFECMIDDDQLQIDLATGKKVPYDLYTLLLFFNSCDYSKVEGWQKIWQENAYKYMSLESAMAYTAFTDYLAAVDQRAKNMQPMFFLEDGCSVEDGVYKGTKGMEAVRMYLNKVYDCDTCNGADNDGGRDLDPEVDPNKPTDLATGYENPYMGSGSVLFNNMDKQPSCWNSNDNGTTTISLQSVVSRMRNLSAQIEGRTLSPFSPAGAQYFFVEKRLMFWPKVVSSYDGERKYIDNTKIANMPYFYALHGLGLTSLPRFIEQRWEIRDGYYQTGDFFTNPLSGRVSAISADSKIHITAAKTGYFGIGNDASGQLSEVVFLEAGQSHSFTNFAHDAGALLYIYQPGRMSRIDLSEMSLAFHFDDLSKLELAEEIILGSATHQNTSLNGFNALGSIVLGDMPFLRKLDVQKTTATSIDASGCPRVETIIANDTPLTTCNVAQTSPIETLTLPATITTLDLVNLPNLTYPGGLTVASFANVNRLWVEGCKFVDTESLVMNIAEAGKVKQIRIPDVNVTASVEVLRKLQSLGAIGLDASGEAYDESGKCSGIIGRWILAELVEDGEITSLGNYFPELTIHNSQFSMVVYTDTEDECENITNLDNNTGYGTNSDYEASGHVKRLEQMSHAYKATFDSERNVMKCEQLSDDDYNYMADGSSIDLTDSSGLGFDIMKHIPSHWYKGVNDFKNQKKYSIRSICESEPISTATNITRKKLKEILVEANTGLVLSRNVVGGSAVRTTNSAMSVYCMDVEGMKQVRWPGINSAELCCVFLDSEDKIISRFQMAVSHSLFDFMVGEDYIFCDVPSGAAKFMFTSQVGCDEMEAIAVDSSHIEAIEPDWVFCKEFLMGVYGMGQDGLYRARSLSNTKAQTGTGTSTSWSGWTYDAEGNVTTQSPPASLNRTCLDCLNLCEIRGKGFHAISYEESKTLANIIMELVGNRDIQAVCGRGRGSGYTTGNTTINGSDVHDKFASAVSKNINAHGNKTIRNSASDVGNVMFGIQNFVACNSEWMSGLVVNAPTFKEWKKAKYPADDGSYPLDAIWHIYDHVTNTERAVQGINNSGQSGYCIGRVRHGRYMDVVPAKVTSDNSAWNKNYSDGSWYTHSRCRAVLRSGSNAIANGGLVYALANYASSVSSTNNGSRLAFSGAIEFVKS